MRDGRRVGVLSNSHKAVLHLMGKAVGRMADEGVGGLVVKMGGAKDEAAALRPPDGVAAAGEVSSVLTKKTRPSSEQRAPR